MSCPQDEKLLVLRKVGGKGSRVGKEMDIVTWKDSGAGSVGSP
jgi:hypothetical protein